MRSGGALRVTFDKLLWISTTPKMSCGSRLYSATIRAVQSGYKNMKRNGPFFWRLSWETCGLHGTWVLIFRFAVLFWRCGGFTRAVLSM